VAISFNETMVRRQVAELKNIASEMRRVSNNDMRNTISGSRSNWRGAAADNFYSRYETLGNNITGEATNIENLADSLEKLLNELIRAEYEAAGIASTRNN